MENKKNKRKLFKRIGAIVGAVVVAIVAFSLPFLGNFKPKFNSKNMVARADASVVTEFKGSSVLLFTGTEIASTFKFYFLNFVFYSDGFKVNVRFEDGTVRSSSKFSYSKGFKDSGISGVRLGVECSNVGFDFSKISYIEIRGYSYGSDICNILTYYDINGYNVAATAYCSTVNVSSSFYYDARQYVLGSSVSDTEQYNMGYSIGYNNGYSTGFSNGENEGYSSGYEAGEGVGYNNGYSVGLENGGKYTFFSLISAVIDAPIQAFMGLFNFELLGINLAGFFTGLLTLAFIVTIVRLVMP